MQQVTRSLRFVDRGEGLTTRTQKLKVNNFVLLKRELARIGGPASEPRRRNGRTKLRVICAFGFLLFQCLKASLAQEPGAVSSGPPTSNTTAITNSDSKPLPWKFLASPMGLLDNKTWPAQAFANFSDPKKWPCDADHKDCTPGQIEALLKDTVGASLTTSPVYVVLHVVNYDSGTGNVLSDAWYLHNRKGRKWSFKKFTSQRIYGYPSVLFLFVHLNVPGLAPDGPVMTGLSDRVRGTFKDFQVVKDDGGTAICQKGTQISFQSLGKGAVADTYANVHYESAVVKRTPANIANLLDILKILGIAQGARTCTEQAAEAVNIWGAGKIDSIGLPSDVSIAGYSVGRSTPVTDDQRAKLQIGSVGAFNDEQLYWWDASIGIPVSKLRDLQYSTSDNQVVASEVNKQTAYAMFNLMLHPVDLSDPHSNVWPRLLVGFPLASSPWDRLFAGGGIGVPLKPLQYFQFFAGATFNRSKQPATLSAGQDATNAQLQNDLKLKTTAKFTFGINVPVKSVLDKLLK